MWAVPLFGIGEQRRVLSAVGVLKNPVVGLWCVACVMSLTTKSTMHVPACCRRYRLADETQVVVGWGELVGKAGHEWSEHV